MNEIIISESELRQQLIDAIEKHTGCSADDCFANINITEDQGGVMVDIEAEIYFDQNETMDYREYRDLMQEFYPDSEIMSKSEYYQDAYSQPTLVDIMDKIIQAYNPDWYFELYNASRIQAWLDNCILEV